MISLYGDLGYPLRVHIFSRHIPIVIGGVLQRFALIVAHLKVTESNNRDMPNLQGLFRNGYAAYIAFCFYEMGPSNFKEPLLFIKKLESN